MARGPPEAAGERPGGGRGQPVGAQRWAGRLDGGSRWQSPHQSSNPHQVSRLRTKVDRVALGPARERSDPHRSPRLRTTFSGQKSVTGGGEEEETIYIRSSMEEEEEEEDEVFLKRV